ncbi:MAG: CYTH domain-containing protein [Patescibacteria group bacterium]
MATTNSTSTKHLEAEFKVALQHKDEGKVLMNLRELGFIEVASCRLEDYYLNLSKSPVKGFDYERVRVEDSNLFLFTKKVWLVSPTQPQRQEVEYKISRDQSQDIINSAKNCIYMVKRRTSYISPRFANLTICIDELRVPYDSNFLLEGEILTDSEGYDVAINTIQCVISQITEISELQEAKGILKYAGSLDPGIKAKLDEFK